MARARLRLRSKRKSPRDILTRNPEREFESLRARHSATEKASPACGFKQHSRSHAASLWLPTKISKTTPCKVAGGRRQGRFGPILDTSGKSTALLHHRTIRETPAGLVERLAKPRLEHGDLGFGRRHVIRHNQCHRSAPRPSTARTRGRGQIVMEIVKWRAGRRTLLRQFLRGSHGATVASLADPQNGRCPRQVTPQRERRSSERWCSRLALSA